MIGKSADSNSSNKNFLRWSEIKISRLNLFQYPFYIITGEVSGHMQMEITGSQNANKIENGNKILQRQENSNRIKAYRPTYKYFCSSTFEK